MPPASVLYLHSSDDLYGADIILLQLVSGLDRARFTPIVVLPYDMRHVGLLSEELTARGIEWMYLPLAIIRRRYFSPSGILWLLFNLVRSTLAVRRIVRQRKIRLIHGFTLAVATAPFAAVAARVPLVMHAHEILLQPEPLRKLIHILGVRWSRRVICVSEATRKNILEDQPAASHRIQVIHNGIEPAKPSGRSITELRAELGVPLEKPLVGMIGRVSPWKGQEVFLQAAAMAALENPHCHFIAIGGVFDNEIHHQERLSQLHKSLKLEGFVTLHGFMKDAREMLPAFDLFISPSTSPDPFPTVILEAMSAGVAVIASAHGGPLEMIVNDVTGILVRPRDARALGNAINALLLDPVRCYEMGRAGQVRFREKFTLPVYLNAVQQLYEEVLRVAAHEAS